MRDEKSKAASLEEGWATRPEIKVHEVEHQGFRVLFLNFVVEGLALESAAQQVSQEHFGGTQFIFDDLQKKNAERNQAAKQLVKSYNAVAPRVGFEPITDGELQSVVSVETQAKTDLLVRLSRAEAVAKFEGIHQARELLLPLIADESNSVSFENMEHSHENTNNR